MELKTIHISKLNYDPSINIGRKNLGDLSDLSGSIKESGILSPILVRRNGEKFDVLSGFRRTHAAIGAGIKDIPCLICEYPNEWDYITVAVVANIHNKQLNPVEEALGLRRLRDEGLSVEKIAEYASKDNAWVYSTLELLDYSDVIVEALENGEIKSASHAHEISRLPLEYHTSFIKKYGCVSLKALRKAVDKKKQELDGLIKPKSDDDSLGEAIATEESVERQRLKETAIKLCEVYRPGLKDDARAFNYKKMPEEFVLLLNRLLMMIPITVEDLRETADNLENGVTLGDAETFVDNLKFWGDAGDLFRQVQSQLDPETIIEATAELKKLAKKQDGKGKGNIKKQAVLEIADRYGVVIK